MRANQCWTVLNECRFIQMLWFYLIICFPPDRLLTDALEDKSQPKRSLGVRIGDWMVEFWQEAADFRVS